MCEASPGPKCSSASMERYAKAKKNYERRLKQIAKLEQAGKAPNYRDKQQMLAAEYRLRSAQRDYDASAAGQEWLSSQIKNIRARSRYVEKISYENRTPKQHALKRELQEQIRQAYERKIIGRQFRQSQMEDQRQFGHLRASILETARKENITPSDINLEWIVSKVKTNEIPWEEINVDISRVKHWTDQKKPFTEVLNPAMPEFRGVDTTSFSPIQKAYCAHARVNIPNGILMDVYKEISLYKSRKSEQYYIVETTVAASQWLNVSTSDARTMPLLFNQKQTITTVKHVYEVLDDMALAEKEYAKLYETGLSYEDLHTAALQSSQAVLVQAGRKVGMIS